MEAIKTSITNSPADHEIKGKVVKKSGKRVGYNYIILRSLKKSQKNDVVTCLYIKSLTNFGICVIKEGTYGDSKDKQGRDIKDRLMWQRQLHESLQYKVRLPRLLGSFEENGNYYLVLERIKGKSLYKVFREAGKDLREGLISGNKLGMKFLGYMIQMTELLETLHNNGVVHRDVTATNFMITPAGRVAVIDMELSYSLNQQFPSPPFQLGTYGYMSPEQEATEMPSIEQDTFSVGAILLQMWTGIWPTKLTKGDIDTLIDRMYFFVPDKVFAEIIIQCLHPDPQQRPILKKVRDTIVNYKTELKNKKLRPVSAYKKFSQNEIKDLVQLAINTLSTPLMADTEKGWFSEDNSQPLHVDKNKINKVWYTSFHKGACGVIYMLSKAGVLGLNVEVTKPHIDNGINLIETRYINRIDEINTGIHFGGAGIAAVLATSIREGLIQPQANYFEWINKLLEKDSQVLEFRHGIAGQGIARLLCDPFLHKDSVEERLNNYATRIMNDQQKDGSWIRPSEDKKNRVTRGFAHGVAGIAYFLLEFAKRYASKEAMESALRGLEWLMKKAVRKGNSYQWRSSADKEVAPWWCEGAPGIALSLLQGYSLIGEPKLKEYAFGALQSHPQKLVDANLSQCHGLSGMGEIYLEAFRITQNDEWLKRADWIVQVLLHLKKEHEEFGPYWLVEHERQPVADFMTGNSGVIHFLMRYCFQSHIGFPLLP